MRSFLTAILFVLTGTQAIHASSQTFPDAPVTVQAAIEVGLQQANSVELKQRYVSQRVEKTKLGRLRQVELRPDGSMSYTDDSGVSDTGNWSVLQRSGGMICQAYSKDMGRRDCLIYFTAPDGVHYFGYDAQDKTWRATGRLRPE